MRSHKAGRRVFSMILSFVMLFSVFTPDVMAAALKQVGTAEKAAQESTEPEIPFGDVGEDSWYYEAVQYAYANGFFNGIDANIFAPDGEMTRGMFVTVLSRMAGINRAAYAGKSVFSDVPADAWYAPGVAWASKHGITVGVGNNLFDPDGIITREQMAVFFVRYFEIFGVEYDTGADITSVPADIDDVSPWARDSVLKLWKAGLLIGDGINFNPKRNASRAHVAALCMRTDKAVATWYKEPGVPSDRTGVSSDDIQTPEPSPGQTPSPNHGDSGGGSDGGDSGGAVEPEPTGPEIGIYSITGVGASAGTHQVTAEVSTMDECYLEIVVYEDDPDSAVVLDRQRVSVKGDSDMATVEISMPKELPRYFGIAASLVDSRGNRLCDPYYLIEFTKMYEEFESKTEADFDADKVIGLDDNSEENFAVIKDDVIMITAGDKGANKLLSRDGNTYVFDDADTVLAGLSVGSKIVVVSEDGSDFYIIEIASIISGEEGTLTIISTDKPTIVDFFDHVNISVTEYMDDPEELAGMNVSFADEDYASSGIMRSAALSEERAMLGAVRSPSLSKDYPMKKSLNKVYGSGGSNLELNALVGLRVYITADIDYSIDWKWGFIPVGLELYAKLGVGVESEIDAVAAATSKPGADNKPLEISIYSSSYNIGYGFTGKLDAKLVVDWSAYAEGEVNIKASAECGIIYNDGSISTYKKINGPKLEPKFEGKITLSIGPKLSASIEWLGGVVDATLWIHPKAVLNANAYYAPERLPTNVASRHECGGCINGTVDFVIDAGFEATYDIEIWDGTLFEKTYPEIYKNRILTFYCSFANSDSSIHGGRVVFGTGICPNVTYKTTFYARNSDGYFLNNAKFTVKNSAGTTVAAGNGDPSAFGEFATYLNNGNYMVSAEAAGEIFPTKSLKISSLSSSVLLESNSVRVTGISLNTTQVTLPVGGTYTFSAAVRPANATNQLTYWMSEDTRVATVDEDGKVTAVGFGTTTITAITNEAGKYATASVAVGIPADGVSLDQSRLTLYTGHTGTLTAAVSPSDATNKKIIWSSNNEFVAAVSDTGTVNAVSAGLATIMARSEDGGFTASCLVVVKEAAEQSALSIVDPGAKTYGDADFDLSAAGGSGTGAVTYSVVGESDVISITGNTVKILKAGTAAITATKDGDDDYRPQTSSPLTITVNKRELDSVTLSIDDVVYSGYAQEPAPMLSGGGGITASDYIAAYSDNIDAGEATVTITAAPDGNYSGTQTVHFTIKKAELTVRADSKQIVSGSPAPTYTYSFYGFVFNDDESVISGEPTLTCDYQQGDVDSAYSIVISQGALTAANYAFTFDNGVLTVGDGASDSYFRDVKVTIGGDTENIYLFNGNYTLDASYESENKNIAVFVYYLSTFITDEELKLLEGETSLALTFNHDNLHCTINIELTFETAFDYSEASIWTLTAALRKVSFAIDEPEP